MRWIIGDIHGMFRPLSALLAGVRAVDPAPQFFFVGDYINRGPDSRSVIDLLLGLDNARFCRGNHDDIFDSILNGACYTPDCTPNDPILAFQWFMPHGLAETLVSYGADLAQLIFLAEHPDLARLQSILTLVPPAHRRFIRDLPPLIEFDDLFIAHARVDPDQTISKPPFSQRLEQDSILRRNIIWGRFTAQEVQHKKSWRRPGFFGHTPVDLYMTDPDAPLLPMVGPDIVLLDTACALVPAGRLTAYCPDKEKFIQVDRAARIVENA
jgi:serine/threonine protein phosphatase 1